MAANKFRCTRATPLIGLGFALTFAVSNAAIQPSPVSIRYLSRDEAFPSEAPQERGLLSRIGGGLRETFSSFPLRLRKERQLIASAAAVSEGPARLQSQEEQTTNNQGPGRAGSTTVLKVFPVKGDGRCMFRSISRALAHAEGRPLSENLETADADFLRNAAYQVICVDKREAFEKSRVIEGDMGKYCNAMRSPNFYGGEPELFVLAEQLRRPITVYVAQQGGFKAVVEYGGKYQSLRRKVRILYNGSNHYDALLD